MDVVKLRIARPDGTVIEVEGTPSDINAVASALGLFQPITLPALPPVPGTTVKPYNPFDPYDPSIFYKTG